MRSGTAELFSNFGVLSIIQVINLLLSLLVLPYVIVIVGAERFGVIAIAQMVMTWLATLSDYGFNLTATKNIALQKENNKTISRIFSTTLCVKIIITLFLFLLLLIPFMIFPALDNYFLLYLMGFAFVAGQSLFVNWFFQGMEKMQYITISTLIGRIIFVWLVFTFIQDKHDDKLYLFFFGVGNIIAGLISIVMAIKIFRIQLQIPGKADIKNELIEGRHITASTLTVNSYYYSNIFILRIFTNDITVGYYSIAERILFAVRQIITLFAQVIFPHLCRIVHKSRQEVKTFFKQIYRPFLLVIISGSCILFLFSKQIIDLFISDGSAVPILLLQLLSFVPVIVYLNILPGQLLLAFDHKKSYVHIITMATVVNLAVNILLSKVWGSTGTALSIVITELFITIGLYMKLYKYNMEGLIKS